MLPLATLWIHRVNASGIIVLCETNEDAYALSCNILERCEDPVIAHWDCKTFPDTIDQGTCFHSGQSQQFQMSIHPNSYVPAGYWNDRGTVRVTAQEAFDLGEEGEPDGFEPYESSGLWEKETRSHAELDQELADYFRLGEIELNQARNELLKYAGIFGELPMNGLLTSKDLEYLKTELNVARYLYSILPADKQAETDRVTRQIQGYFIPV